jgi:hypothetical protein
VLQNNLESSACRLSTYIEAWRDDQMWGKYLKVYPHHPPQGISKPLNPSTTLSQVVPKYSSWIVIMSKNPANGAGRVSSLDKPLTATRSVCPGACIERERSKTEPLALSHKRVLVEVQRVADVSNPMALDCQDR